MFNGKMIGKLAVGLVSLCLVCGASLAGAQEVGKGKIPESQLEKSYRQLDWGVAIWDVDDVVKAKKDGASILWVDTRPASFFSKGTVRDAVSLIYNMKGKEENTLSADSLTAALGEAGMTKENGKIVFFCQGPTCHRSYNATYTSVTEWGFSAGNIIWFREGYPYLFKAVKENAKLKRKAKKYISDDGLSQL